MLGSGLGTSRVLGSGLGTSHVLLGSGLGMSRVLGLGLGTSRVVGEYLTRNMKQLGYKDTNSRYRNNEEHDYDY